MCIWRTKNKVHDRLTKPVRASEQWKMALWILLAFLLLAVHLIDWSLHPQSLLAFLNLLSQFPSIFFRLFPSTLLTHRHEFSTPLLTGPNWNFRYTCIRWHLRSTWSLHPRGFDLLDMSSSVCPSSYRLKIMKWSLLYYFIFRFCDIWNCAIYIILILLILCLNPPRPSFIISNRI